MSEVDLPTVRRALHDAAFSVLRSGTRDPWSIQQNEAQARSVMAASLQGEEVTNAVPEFASRLVLPGKDSIKPRVKLIMQTEEKFAKYMELLDIVDSVRSREERCSKFRTTLKKHKPDLEQSISDGIFELEMEELKLKRDVRSIVRGEDPNGPVSVESEAEKLAMFAATSVQPALRAVLHAALKNTGAEPAREEKSEWEMAMERGRALELEEEGGGGGAEEQGGGTILHRDDGMDRLAKKLERATRGGLREAAVVREGISALEDRGRALVSLRENLREEVRAAAQGEECEELQERRGRKEAQVERLKRLSQNGRDASYPAAVLAAAARRRCALDAREAERRGRVARVLQGCVRRQGEEGLLGHGRVLCAWLRVAAAKARRRGWEAAAEHLQAVARRGVVKREEAEGSEEVVGGETGERVVPGDAQEGGGGRERAGPVEAGGDGLIEEEEEAGPGEAAPSAKGVEIEDSEDVEQD